MEKKKIAYICGFSNVKVQSALDLHDLSKSNKIRRYFHLTPLEFADTAPWNSLFIEQFSKDNEHEYYVIAPQIGMRDKKQSFMLDGIHYIFYRNETGVLDRFKKKLLNYDERTDFRHYRRIVKSILKNINPDLAIVCGAENPIYSSAMLDIENIPVYVILQTLLNDPKRIAMGVGDEYRRNVERRILLKGKYFGVVEKAAADYIKKNNPSAYCFDFNFPTSIPHASFDAPKAFDYIFFARGITKNKGVEDVIRAFAIVCTQEPNATLNISGGCSDSYLSELKDLVGELKIAGNVTFHGHFKKHIDVFHQLAKARCIVVPGITSALNTTVKEAMLMKLPTICYKTSATPRINKENQCLITAEMENVNSLADAMLFAYQNPTKAQEIARNGYDYATSNYTAEAVCKNLMSNIKSIFDHEAQNIVIPITQLFKTL